MRFGPNLGEWKEVEVLIEPGEEKQAWSVGRERREEPRVALREVSAGGSGEGP